MGCTSTPMPNHLSTYLSLPLNHKTTHKRVGGKKSEVWGKEEVVRRDERCGNGEVEMVMRLRRRKGKISR